MHELVILIAKYFILLPPLLLAAVWLQAARSAKLQIIATLAAGAILSLVLAEIGRKLYNDPRPFVAGHFTPYFSHGADNGFPSDHTLFAACVAYITLIFSTRLGAVALVIAAFIGASRVIAGVHHFTDILGSLIFAGVGVGLSWLVVKRLTTHRES